MSKKNVQQEKKNKILMGLHNCLLEKSFNDTSIKDIANKAGMNHGLLHYYFNSKEDILLEYVDFVASRYIDLIDESIETKIFMDTDISNIIREIFSFIIDRIYMDKELVKVLIQIWSIAAYNEKIKLKIDQVYLQLDDKILKIIKKSNVDDKTAVELSEALTIFSEGIGLFSLLRDIEKEKMVDIIATFGRTLASKK